MNSLIKLNSNGKKGLFPELPSLFDDFVTRDFFNLPTFNLLGANRMPAVNIKETDSAFELEMAAPGMNKKDFKIEVEHNNLIISAQHQAEKEEKDEDGKYTRREFSFQSFRREFQLPENNVNEDDITANYKNGLLQILVPKMESNKPKLLKEIAIS